jgi:hypothetical protein
MTPEISNNIKENKKAFWEWREAGKSNPDHPLSEKRKETKRNLRRTQRLDTATKRTDDTVLDLPSADVFCSSIISAVTVRWSDVFVGSFLILLLEIWFLKLVFVEI